MNQKRACEWPQAVRGLCVCLSVCLQNPRPKTQNPEPRTHRGLSTRLDVNKLLLLLLPPRSGVKFSLHECTTPTAKQRY